MSNAIEREQEKNSRRDRKLWRKIHGMRVDTAAKKLAEILRNKSKRQ